MVTHLPVMAREVIELLKPERGGVYVDATVGLGGHAEKILGHLGSGGRLIGIDRDTEALQAVKARLSDERMTLMQGRFSEMKSLLAGAGVDRIDGILFDFGVSMMQLKSEDRGFSFSSDEMLDMRMDKRQRLTAQEIVNTYPTAALEKMVREFGEERHAAKIARAIVLSRRKKSITTCTELAGIVKGACRQRSFEKRHPATKTFQALRIAVNDELREIREGLGASLDLLRQRGRLCAISYHSLEDREVKQFLRHASTSGLVHIMTKKPLTPSAEEVRENPSARSAKLRGAERK